MISTINNAIAKKREDGEKGFTLIELLVVILIIGVLAAIAIPAFLNQRQGAWQSQVESDLKNAAIAAEQYAVSNNGSYANLVAGTSPGTAPAPDRGLEDYGFNKTAEVSVWIEGTPDATGFVLRGNHTSITDKTWEYTSSNGTISEIGHVATPGAGG
ncbi:MAG: prepilin-type N-terminal cleavage/methylation domain-containing protein [Salinibacterium sp.]|nr:prepilin-type N-terminal cleavage/methylation domain-containing protein [Salinibacterium sp.]MBF0672659.1 prepilin-type N-terminal cleavage/methylation domain-containing protein [Salinibacterium sp.]